MKSKLIPAGQNPYRISANERAKLPAEFLRRNGLVPGKSLVYVYLDEAGDLVVSRTDYRENSARAEGGINK